MAIDIELYRYQIPVSRDPLVHLSVIDIAPENPLWTMVFVHGFGGRASQWIYQLQEFSIKNRVVALDLRGHGRSDKPDNDYKMGLIQRDLLCVIDELKIIEKFILIGHSFGGAVATEFSVRNPTIVAKLVLIATAGEYKLNLPTRLGLKLPLPLLNLIEPLTRKWLHAPLRVLQPWFINNLSTWNGWSMFRDVSTPTLVVRGHRDIVFESPLFEEVSRAIPEAEDINVGSSGHMVMLERRDAVNRAIKRFIEATQSSWRENNFSSDQSIRDELLQERPWLRHYDKDVPYTIAVPYISLPHLLESAINRFPRKPAILYYGKQISYRKLGEEVNKFANGLLNIGLQKGDRVMILLPNIPQLIICYFGILKAGGVPVFTMPNTEADELIRQVVDSGSKVLVTLTQFENIARQVKLDSDARSNSPLQHIILTQSRTYLPFVKRFVASLSSKMNSKKPLKTSEREYEDFFLLNDILKEQTKNGPFIEVHPNDLAVLQYTGGTTNDPKGVMLSHRNLIANTLQTRHWMPEAKEGKERVLCVIPISHIYGLTTALNLPIALGASLVLLPRFEVNEILKTIKRTKPTLFPGVPSMYVAIGNYPGVRKYGIDSINACISGSAPLAMEVQEEFEKLTRGRLVEGYGLTEASPVTHANPLNGLRKVGSIGIPLPSTEARIFDLSTEKKRVSMGQIGELAVRGPQVMMGYWNNQTSTGETKIKGDWLLTGDVAIRDSDGYFKIVARKAHMWYPSKPDKPAFPRDVEEVIYEIPQVKEAVVVAIAGQPIAFVITPDNKNRPSSESIIAYCKRRLPPELVPKFVIFVDDFPRTFIGKVIRRELAKRFEQTH